MDRPRSPLTGPDRASAIWAMSGLSVWNQGVKEHWFLGMGHYDETDEKAARTLALHQSSTQIPFHSNVCWSHLSSPGRAGDQAARTSP